MKYRPTFLSALFVALGLFWGAPLPAADRPNVVVILADDIGAHELGIYGHPDHQTPHLDKLATTGIYFATGYTNPICHPTRFAIMTGQYAHHTGVYHFPGRPGGPPTGKGGPDDITDIVPTICEVAGIELPADHIIDGVSFAPYLRGETTSLREWIYAPLGTKRVLRTKRWLLENNSPADLGQLYDCGNSRDGTGYKDVTDSTDPEVFAAKKLLKSILADKPVPGASEGNSKPKPGKFRKSGTQKPGKA